MKVYITAALTLLYADFSHAKGGIDIPAIDCMIEPNVLVELSSPVAGVLDTLSVDKSDEVKKGQIIATLKSDIEQVDVKSSREKLKLSAAEYKRAAELYREKAITKSEKEQLDNNKKLAELELKHAKTSLDLRNVKSPIDGIVVKRYANPGEFVETNPIIQLAQLNPLRIEIVSPVSNYGNIVKGMEARIVPEFGKYDDLVAKVVVVDKVVDAASGTFSVRLELENKDHAIPGGLKCSAKFMPVNKVKVAKAVNKINPVKVKAVKKQVTQSPKKPTIKPENTIVKNNVNKSDVKSSVSTSNASHSMMCTKIGPYKKLKTVNTLLAKLNKKSIKAIPKTEFVPSANKTYLVESNSFASLADREQMKSDIEFAGFTDIAVSGGVSDKRLAFGLFRSEASATKRMRALKNKGFDVTVRLRQGRVKTYWAEITYLSADAKDIARHIPSKYRHVCNK